MDHRHQHVLNFQSTEKIATRAGLLTAPKFTLPPLALCPDTLDLGQHSAEVIIFLSQPIRLASFLASLQPSLVIVVAT